MTSLNTRIDRLERTSSPGPVDYTAARERVVLKISTMAANLRADPNFQELTPEESKAVHDKVKAYLRRDR